jgi:hypothetical protein
MITLRVWFLVVTTTLALAVGAWSTLATAAPTGRTTSSRAIAAGTGSRGDVDAGRASSLTMSPDPVDKLLRPTEPHVDVFGNEIEDAVTDYRIDSTGDVYERHSPETEVPRLGPPLM